MPKNLNRGISTPIVIVIIFIIVIIGIVMVTKQQKRAKEVPFCPIGASKEIEGKRGKITGIENYIIEGKSVNLCCGEVESRDKKAKICLDDITGESTSYSIGWIADEETKWQYIKLKETYPKEGKNCVRIFNRLGNVIGENCF
jgi:hypothetical protein